MTTLNDWCDDETKQISGHELTVLTAHPDGIGLGTAGLRKALPSHYASPARIASLLRKLGKDATADYIAEKLPTKKKSRSGDLCEILAVSYIEENTIFVETIRKLRWSDHREQPMRGDDVIAVAINADNPNELFFLKGEAKSRANLGNSPVKDARKALKSSNGRPTPHALTFFSDRLEEDGREDISNLVDYAQRVTGIRADQLTHLIFTFSGNNPEKYLVTDLEGYTGKIEQWSVGLRVPDHQDFIRSVFEG